MFRKLIAVLVVGAVYSMSATAGDWFDMQNCGICKSMGDQMSIMHEIKWETHKLHNGILSVSVIPEQHREAMQKAHDEMHAAIDRLQEGESMELCGHCQSYGQLVGMGAKQEEFESAVGAISLLTSDDPEIVKKIHEHSQRSEDEYKKMMGQMEPAS